MSNPAPFLNEHHLLRRMLALVDQEKQRLEGNMAISPEFAFVEPRFLRAVVVFFRDFVAAIHQHKEERFLFPALADKPLAPEDRQLLAALLVEHQLAHDAVSELATAVDRYQQGHETALMDILAGLVALIRIYQRHLTVEEQDLLPLATAHISPGEQEALLAQSRAFDEQYDSSAFAQLVTDWEARGCKCHL